MPANEDSSSDDQPFERLDPELFVSLVVANEARVRAFITSLMMPSSDVDDVFQSTCMAAFRKIGSFRHEGKQADEAFVRWVCTIAKYEVLLYYRRRRTGKVSFSTEIIEQMADMQIESMDLIQDRSDALKECLEALEENEKSLIQLRYGKEVPVAEIGKLIGLTSNGVYKKLERLRARLLSCVSARLRAEGLA